MADLPKPPIPTNVDLRDFAFMPLDVMRLRDSDLAALATADEFRAAVMLWCAAWHQVPAGSLPDDVRALTHLAGLGRDIKTFESVRGNSMRHFRTHSDGRLYHPVICEKAMEAWGRKEEAAERREADRQRKRGAREEKAQLNQGPRPNGQDEDTPRTSSGSPPGRPPEVRSMTGTGTGTRRNHNAADAASPDLTDLKTQFYHRGRGVLGKKAGGQLTKLLAAMEDNVPRARSAIETASTKADPRSYVASVIQRRNEEAASTAGETHNPVLTL